MGELLDVLRLISPLSGWQRKRETLSYLTEAARFLREAPAFVGARTAGEVASPPAAPTEPVDPWTRSRLRPAQRCVDAALAIIGQVQEREWSRVLLAREMADAKSHCEQVNQIRTGFGALCVEARGPCSWLGFPLLSSSEIRRALACGDAPSDP